MEHAAEYDNLVVAWRNGSPVRLKEIANVYDSVENKQIAGWVGHDRSIVLAVFRQSDANTVDVVDNVKARIPYYQSQLPPSVEAQVLNDRSVSIRQSIDDVQLTLLLSIALVVIVIFVFLKSAAATLIPALALPVSLIGACAFMYHVRLFDRQYLAARDHAVGRLRRRRRDRHAREHHAPYRGAA